MIDAESRTQSNAVKYEPWIVRNDYDGGVGQMELW
jgi:hypothetical protein